MSVRVVISGNVQNVVRVENLQNGYLGLTLRGPQGPAFAGEQFFDTSAIESLTVADSGVTVKWNGSQFVPASELSDGITVNGGAF